MHAQCFKESKKMNYNFSLFFFCKTSDSKPIVSPFFHPPPGQEYEKINAIKGEVIFLYLSKVCESNWDVLSVLIFLSSREDIISCSSS